MLHFNKLLHDFTLIVFSIQLLHSHKMFELTTNKQIIPEERKKSAKADWQFS